MTEHHVSALGGGNDAAERYESYENMFDPPSREERAWREGRDLRWQAAERRRAAARPAQEVESNKALAIAMEGLEGGFHPTYRPSRFEEGWLLDSLRSFYEDGLLSDVLALVKGGKEANVYRCAAQPTTGLDLVAAKVYRPRMFRNLRNDALYRRGREILTEDGTPVKKTDDRVMRAIGKKTAFGQQVSHTSWLMHEYVTLRRLHEAGAAVPRPLGASENAILMGYHGDERRAAPTLNTVSLSQAEAKRLFREVLRNVELMLKLGIVHGDLSAYNVLYWKGEIVIIDFPQMVDCIGNDQARDILRRDLTRTCEYFSSQGVECDAEALTGDLWGQHVGSMLRAQLADLSMREYEREIETAEEV